MEIKESAQLCIIALCTSLTQLFFFDIPILEAAKMDTPYCPYIVHVSVFHITFIFSIFSYIQVITQTHFIELEFCCHETCASVRQILLAFLPACIHPPFTDVSVRNHQVNPKGERAKCCRNAARLI